MPAGIQVTGSHGTAQIDETNKNVVLISSGSKAVGDWISAGYYSYVNVNIGTTAFPIVAFRCTELVSLGATYQSSGDWIFQFHTPNPATLYWYLFAESPSASPDNFGLEIYTAGAERVFHSSQKALRVVGTGAGTYGSGRTYAAIRTNSGYAYTSVSSGLPFPEEWQYDSTKIGVEIDSNVVTISDFTTSSALVINDVGNYTSVVTTTHIIDVTNF